jgi:alkylation response protein AidB-like acyl-CoA dehydrogenase
MPFALIVRMLTRLAVLAGVVFVRRRARSGVPVPPSHRTPGTGAGGPRVTPPEWLRALGFGGLGGVAVPDVLEGARLAALGLALLAFAAAALVLTSAGTTLTVLSPRWLGITMLVVAALFAAGAVREAVWLRRGLALRRRKRRLEHIAGPQ